MSQKRMRARKMKKNSAKKIMVDLSSFQPTVLQRAFSLEIARTFDSSINPNEPISIKMALSNAFLSGIAFANIKMTEQEVNELKSAFAETIERIEIALREERKNEA